MRRRDLLTLIGGAAVIGPLRGYAQRTQLPVIGFLGGNRRSDPLIAAFEAGLSENGYADGQNVHVEYRWAEGHWDRLSGLANDLISKRVDVITTSGGDVVALEVKQSTSTIPIIAQIGGDPEKLVASIAHPGGNLTGVSFLTLELTPKRFELLTELLGQPKVVAMLVNPKGPNAQRHLEYGQQAASATGVQLDVIKASNETEIDAAFADQLHADALVVGADAFFAGRRDQLVSLAARYAVPTIYEFRYFVDAGGLLSYGTSVTGVYRQAGSYVGKILKGAKPADLPVQQPTKFELVINLKTAKALGLTIPQSLLARADEVIE